MPLKRINKQKQRKPIHKKKTHKRAQQQKRIDRQSQIQNVYINTHRRQTPKTQSNKSSTSQHSIPYHHVTVVPFQPPLPYSHPFVNGPVQIPQTTPLNTNVPQTSSLAATVGAVPPVTAHTPRKMSKLEEFYNDPNTPFKIPPLRDYTIAKLRSIAEDRHIILSEKEYKSRDKIISAIKNKMT